MHVFWYPFIYLRMTTTNTKDKNIAKSQLLGHIFTSQNIHKSLYLGGWLLRYYFLKFGKKKFVFVLVNDKRKLTAKQLGIFCLKLLILKNERKVNVEIKTLTTILDASFF